MWHPLWLKITLNRWRIREPEYAFHLTFTDNLRYRQCIHTDYEYVMFGLCIRSWSWAHSRFQHPKTFMAMRNPKMEASSHLSLIWTVYGHKWNCISARDISCPSRFIASMSSSQQCSDDFLANLADLEQRLEEFESDDDLQEEDSENGHSIFLGILQGSCSLVRDAETSGISNFSIIVDRVDQLINNAVRLAYGDAEIYSSIPSFAHTEDATAPMICDRQPKGFMCPYMSLSCFFYTEIVSFVAWLLSSFREA